MSLRYDILYRSQIETPADWQNQPTWDFFVSAYNSSQRLRTAYDGVSAKQKLWVIHPEYNFQAAELPQEPYFAPVATDESGFVREIFEHLDGLGFEFGVSTLCVDITGMMRPHILFLTLYLSVKGQKKVNFIYSEPERYAEKERTSFSVGQISEVRSVHGYQGSPNQDSANDVLVIGMGYDHRMIKEVAEDQDKARKVQLYGLPPLRADMYQESVLRSRIVADSVADPEFLEANRASAPAGDPFATASVLSDLISKIERKAPITNLFLSPVGTKAQVLGFGIYFIAERQNGTTSIIFPFSEAYTPETSYGFHRAWNYEVEFPL